MALDFALSSDQLAVADAFGAFFAAESDIGVVRAAEPLGFAPELWVKLAAIDAPGMAAAAGAGGSAASLSALAVVAEAVGASIAPVPIIEHWLASRLCSDSDVVTGTSVATIALRPAVDGCWRLVPAGAVADVVVGVDGGDTVAVRSAPECESVPNHSAAPLADRSAREGERTVLGPAAIFAEVLDLWRLLTAAALVGIADRGLRIGLDYVREREQFGQPIGAFQSIQHGLADCPALIDGARFLVHKGAWSYDNGLHSGSGVIDMNEGLITEFDALAAMALLQASEAATVCTDRSLHYHGGYGFSVEYDIQLYFRRARGWANILGDPAQERLRLADLLWTGDA